MAWHSAQKLLASAVLFSSPSKSADWVSRTTAAHHQARIALPDQVTAIRAKVSNEVPVAQVWAQDPQVPSDTPFQRALLSQAV